MSTTESGGKQATDLLDDTSPNPKQTGAELDDFGDVLESDASEWEQTRSNLYSSEYRHRGGDRVVLFRPPGWEQFRVLLYSDEDVVLDRAEKVDPDWLLSVLEH